MWDIPFSFVCNQVIKIKGHLSLSLDCGFPDLWSLCAWSWNIQHYFSCEQLHRHRKLNTFIINTDGKLFTVVFFKIIHKILNCFIINSSHKDAKNIKTLISDIKTAEQSNICLEKYRRTDSHILPGLWPLQTLQLMKWTQHTSCVTLHGFQRGCGICTTKHTARPAMQ